MGAVAATVMPLRQVLGEPLVEPLGSGGADTVTVGARRSARAATTYRLSDDDDRAVGVVDDVIAGRPKQQLGEPAVPARADDDEIGVAGTSDQDLGRCTVNDRLAEVLCGQVDVCRDLLDDFLGLVLRVVTSDDERQSRRTSAAPRR